MPLERVHDEMKSEAHRAFCASYAASDYDNDYDAEDADQLLGYSDFCNGIQYILELRHSHVRVN